MKIKNIITTLMIMAAPLAAHAQNEPGIKAENMNTAVRPGDDFYRFATGGWMEAHPLPATKSRYGSFDMLAEDNDKRINSIISDLQKKRFKDGTIEKKLADFYRLATDSDRREREGIMPVRPYLDEIGAVKTVDDARSLMRKHAKMGIGMQYDGGFYADEKNSRWNIFYLTQGGLTLSNRDYYVLNDSATIAIREAYRQFIRRMFMLYGFDEQQATAKCDIIFRTETVLALVSKSNTELRDPIANYNKMTLAEVEGNYPNLQITTNAVAEGINSDHLKEVVVGQPKFFEALDRLVALYDVDVYKALMQWDVIMSSYPYLTNEIRLAAFDFFGRTMTGRKEEEPLWKRATQQISGQMGEALGRMYTERYFPASSKQKMETLVENLRLSLAQRIDAQQWMSDTTKAAAHEKLDKFRVKIGYPDKWTDISGLTIDGSRPYYDNILACRTFWHDKRIADRAGREVDRDEWHMTPQTVNAYYNPTTNEICFPAGILQYPFFDAKADEAFNYGAIGVVIGHEMTHGFDDQGRQYDSDGNMHDWWTASDAEGFTQRADLYADFFSNIEVLPGLKGNGRFTLGENLADHGGLQVAYNAFLNATQDKKDSRAMGYTAPQRFFIAYAGIWGQNITEREIRNRVKVDPHAQGEWRVNGALPHIDAWYDAFNIQHDDKLYIPKEQRLDLW